jgi:hypothetical protein
MYKKKCGCVYRNLSGEMYYVCLYTCSLCLYVAKEEEKEKKREKKYK